MIAGWNGIAISEIPLTVTFGHVPLTMCCLHMCLGPGNILRLGGKRGSPLNAALALSI